MTLMFLGKEMMIGVDRTVKGPVKSLDAPSHLMSFPYFLFHLKCSFPPFSMELFLLCSANLLIWVDSILGFMAPLFL